MNMNNQHQPTTLMNQLPNEFLTAQLKHYELLREQAKNNCYSPKNIRPESLNNYRQSMNNRYKLFMEIVLLISEELHQRTA